LLPLSDCCFFEAMMLAQRPQANSDVIINYR